MLFRSEQLKNENTEIKAENKSLSEEISSMKEKQDRMSEELNTIRTQFTSMTNIINQFSSGTSQDVYKRQASSKRC